MAKKEQFDKGEIIIYETSKKQADLKVRLENETIWLTQAQIALLFGTQRPAITKHLSNIFKANELDEKVVSSILEHTTKHGAIKGKTQTKKVKFYNLDAIISVGYHVNSQKATKFRIWATSVLKKYLVQGYAINQKRLKENQEKFIDLQNTINFLAEKARKKNLSGQELEILNLLKKYSKSLTLLEEYDKSKLKVIKGKVGKVKLDFEYCLKIIKEIKLELVKKKEASGIFGNRRGESFEGIIKGIYQTFAKKELYPDINTKSAHLLYFIIKDHPFTDGNKRIASFLFVYFLDINNHLYYKNGEKKINDNALVAIALLVAESKPKEKEMMIKLIMNLIK